jgi:hypothetical protein
VVVQLNEHWRIIVCRSNIQWILQRSYERRRDGERCWGPRSYCRTGEAIKRLARQHAGAIDPEALAVLDALPAWVEAPPAVEGATEMAEAAE